MPDGAHCRFIAEQAKRLIGKHDASMERQVYAFLGNQSTIAFMGGHDRLRDDPAFTKVATLARTLRRAGKMIVTGGGPGFMEAANLSAFLAPYDDAALADAMAILIRAPKYTDTHQRSCHPVLQRESRASLRPTSSRQAENGSETGAFSYLSGYRWQTTGRYSFCISHRTMS
ncbi:hypothetical protein CA223_15730 [Sphingomonas koreensis]|uniref:Uncharacterized protein n=1 Tax=Sphingomonas koreensis TaxID=93064 RepID=A0A1L6JDH8_9SPHN|nr:hypothetical protein [Sphingomonas koreensis]APR53887.1 hypothetical protein BRX40_17040 [Sphingomonas koreensis]MDC7808774.1 hypothetical protein [Sphingomonas koreensis]RSU18958.1 hypothetical protein CA224_13765 [Sphingomonas koreensis]RSU24034.1 hypothetical protein CA222_14130 [Sphingomonas koreensis]RSU33874.1 hypothetical protein BRX39_11490 [Sphingomonas koreensis]